MAARSLSLHLHRPLRLLSLLWVVALTLIIINLDLDLSRQTVDASTEVDVLWSFDLDNQYEGWADDTTEKRNIEFAVRNGELRGTIIGELITPAAPYPFLNSPPLDLSLTTNHFINFRLMYFGSARKAQLLLKSGSSRLRNGVVQAPDPFWRSPAQPSIVRDSGSVGLGYESANVLDDDLHSFYLVNQTSGVELVFDLGVSRWINVFTLTAVGDSNSPRRCLLQKSLTQGVGPFATVASLLVQPNTTAEQEFLGFEEFSRYWRLLVLSNAGGSGVGIRHVGFKGYNKEVSIVPFDLDNTGKYKNYYLPTLMITNGFLQQIRLEILYEEYDQYDNGVQYNATAAMLARRSIGKYYREGLSIDFIRIARAPIINRVMGCIDMYYSSADRLDAMVNLTSIIDSINGNLDLHLYTQIEMDLTYASTYNCPLVGGVPITIQGHDFGFSPVITIAGQLCPIISMQIGTASLNPNLADKVVCRLPATTSMGLQNVRIQNGAIPGLDLTVPYLSYQARPIAPATPIVSNLAAYKVDLVWSPPGLFLQNLVVSGYKLLWFDPTKPGTVYNTTVGNVTTTSIRGLSPGTEYAFSVAAYAGTAEDARLPMDLYGRRLPSPTEVLGEFSVLTSIVATLDYDFDFNLFNANKTHNISGLGLFQSQGPTGLYGAEGHYGLILVGDANIQNCNVSSTCCDGYNATIGLASCGSYQSVCAVLPERSLAYEYVIDGVTRREVPSNLPYSNGRPPEINIISLSELITNKGAALPTASCGPALRLTPSQARSSGAAWYRRKMNVREGFDTFIKFQISNPSLRCDAQDDVNTYCRSRGADGFAFVIQNVGPLALGLAGSGLGYEGIFNSLAIELDTYHNFDQMDYYENHIAVMTQGWRFNISANHSRSLATATKIPDLTDGIHTVRIKYDPVLEESAIHHPSFQVNGFTSWFIENADYEYGGMGDWGTGFGLLYVYVDDLYSPVITTALNLEYTLQLDNGRAMVGITAATGDNHWQAHDILEWQFSSLYHDIPYEPPVVINGQGAFSCVNETVCMHHPDFDHYMRSAVS